MLALTHFIAAENDLLREQTDDTATHWRLPRPCEPERDRPAADPSDEALLAAVAGGDEASLGVLYDRHGAAAMGLAYRIVSDRRTAEEVVQDAFVAVWRRAGTFLATRGTGRSWLLGIVHHRAIDRVRGRAATAAEAGVDLVWAEQTAAPEDVWATVARTLTREEIEAALTQLSRDQRQAIELGFFRGLTHVEVAEEVGAPLGTVKGRMRHGLLRLQSLLAPEAAWTI